MQGYTGPEMQDPELLGRLVDVRVPTLLLLGENDLGGSARLRAHLR